MMCYVQGSQLGHANSTQQNLHTIRFLITCGAQELLSRSYILRYVFVRYKRLFMSGQNRQLSKRFKPLIGSFLVVSLCIFEEACILLELLFHAELNSVCHNSVY